MLPFAYFARSSSCRPARLRLWLVLSPSSLVALLVLFFFSSRRRHTRCLSDWSSDVCSSDLLGSREERHSRLRQHVRRDAEQDRREDIVQRPLVRAELDRAPRAEKSAERTAREDRKSVV